MKLEKLLAGVNVVCKNVPLTLEITDVVYDSRKVTPGCMFVAVTGFATDGNKYIPMALEKGAAVVVTARPQTDDIPYVQVASDRLALAQIGANFYDHPGKAMKLIGITGTNGKTSSTLLRHPHRAHHPGELRAAGAAGANAGCRLHLCHYGGFLPRHCTGACGGPSLYCGGFYQPYGGPSGFPQNNGRLLPHQGRAVFPV